MIQGCPVEVGVGFRSPVGVALMADVASGNAVGEVVEEAVKAGVEGEGDWLAGLLLTLCIVTIGLLC